jgi:hypothetical protein
MNAILKDHLGNESSMRAMFVGVVAIIFIVWAIICVWKMEIVDMPPGITAVIMAIFTAKVWQKYAEVNAPISEGGAQ